MAGPLFSKALESAEHVVTIAQLSVTRVEWDRERWEDSGGGLVLAVHSPVLEQVQGSGNPIHTA
jgi:hypothetical protein